MRIVIIDDDRSLRSLLSMLLDRHPSIDVVGTAADGQQALEVVAATSPDVALLDLMLVGERGTELIAPLLTRVPDLMVVMFTGFPSEHAEEEALAAGAHAFYEKSRLSDLAVRLLADHDRFRAADHPAGRCADGTHDAPAPDAPSGPDPRLYGDARLRALSQSLVELAAGVLGSSAASLWWHDDQAAYQIARHPQDLMPTTMRFSDMPDVGASIRAGELQLYQRSEASEAVRQWMDNAGIEVSLRVPVGKAAVPNQFLGVSWSTGTAPPMDEVVPLAERLADHAAMSFSNAVSSFTRERTALELSDNVAQALVVAQAAIELGDVAGAQSALERAYEQLQRIMSRLLDQAGAGTVQRLGPTDTGGSDPPDATEARSAS